MSLYQITIVNNSGTNSKKYGIFSEKPAIKGSGFTSAVQMRSFEFSSSFYAFVGRSDKQSRTLESGLTKVALEHSCKAVLGNDFELGSDLKVGTDLVISGNNKAPGIPAGSFSMGAMSTISSPNFWVMGVARDLMRNHAMSRIVPVAGIELRRAARVTFTPSRRILIALTDLHIGDTCTGGLDPDAMAVVEFDGSMAEATVTEMADGSFEVEYA